MAEFLPLCDVLFNVISLAGYFCDVVFDVVFCYALLERGRTTYFAVVIILVILSLLISQIVSIRWYLNKLNTNYSEENTPDTKVNKPDTRKANLKESNIVRYCVIILHISQMGVLWRYAKLFVPVDLRLVKNEVRDLCMLRLVHAFCEAAPMLLLQLYVLTTMQNEDYMLMNPEVKLKSLGTHVVTSLTHQPTITQQQQIKTFRELNIVSAVLSLFSVCWALASFSKNVRLQNVHRLVLTWLGVIFQFLWRLGTVVSRITSLTVYASLYSYWIFLVIILHWISMFLWLISPKNVFHGERISRLRKSILACLIAFVYIFAYINLQEVNHRQKMITFYVVMFMENCLLVCLWIAGVWFDKPEGWLMVPILVFCSFLIGMVFMLLYYRYFHVRRLRYESGGRFQADTMKKSGDCLEHGSGTDNLRNNCTSECTKYSTHTIPGVFNCRFSNPVVNAATKRKKKKPTTFVPPPNLTLSPRHVLDTDSTGHMAVPFWRRPLPRSQTGGSSENEGSAGSRVNIHQKLQEKKQKQLAELKIIEEEIKQGKLGGPAISTLESGDDMRGSLPRQPIPRVKKHINVEPLEWRSGSPEMRNNSKMFNDLNILSSANIDEVNNLNKFSTNYDPLYNSFGLNSINIPAISKDIFRCIDTTPLSPPISESDCNTLKQQIMSRNKLPFNILQNPFSEQYHENFQNIYAEGTAALHPSISPLNAASNSNRKNHFDHHSGLYLEVNHLRQISGTYSSCVDNTGLDNLPFPYNVVPPPKSKLESRHASVPMKPVIGPSRLTQRQIQRSKTPEILLAPHYLDNSRVYYDWVTREPSSRNYIDGQQAISSGDENLDEINCSNLENSFSRNRPPSDIDSQVSLPRSYTLPREFKYYRRNKSRKAIKNEHFIASTNSSDGDVDSGDDNESERHSNNSNHLNNNGQQCLRPPLLRSNFHNHVVPVGSASTTNTNNITSSPLSHQNGLINGCSSNYFYISKPKVLGENSSSNVEYLNNSVLEPASSNGERNNIVNRQTRLRAYGNNKNGIRHETKL